MPEDSTPVTNPKRLFMDVNSGQGHQSQPEEIPSSDSLGLQHPLLPPPVLGQSFLQPHTLSPLGTVSLISLDATLPTETAQTNSLNTHFAAQVPTEVLDNSSSSSSNIPRSVATQFPEAQPSTLAPKAPAKNLQSKLEQSSPHQKLPKAPNNTGKIHRNAAPEVEPSSSIETNAVLNVAPTQAAAPSIQPTQHQVSTQSLVPHSEQVESAKQIAQDQSSPDTILQPKLVQTSKLSPPSNESHAQESALSPASSPIDNTPELQTSSEGVAGEPSTEFKPQPEQTPQKPIAHPPSKAISPEVSASSHPTDVPPLQTKHQDLPEIKITSEPSAIQESLPKSQEQATPPNSDVKSSSLDPSPLANSTKSDSSPTKTSEVSPHIQPNRQKVSSAPDHSLAPSTQNAQVAQSKEEAAPKASPLSSQKPVVSSKPVQEKPVANAQSPESQPVPIQTSLEAAAQDIELTTPPTEQATDITTDLPAKRTIQSSPISPNELQTSSSQASLANSKVEANPSRSVDSGSSIETPVTPSPKPKTTDSPIKTTIVQTVTPASPQQSLDDESLLLENSEPPSSTTKISDSSTETTTIQNSERSTVQQSSTDHPQTPKVETNRINPSNDLPSVESPPIPSISEKIDREALQSTAIQRADDLTPQASTKAPAKKQKKQSKKSKQKKLPLQAQLSRMGKRAKQDIDKVGIQLKQASQSLPVGQSKAKTNEVQKSTSDSPQLSNAPLLQAKSSPDSKQSSSEVSLVQKRTKAVEKAPSQELSQEKLLSEKTENADYEENSPTLQAIPESIDLPQEHSPPTPLQTKSLGTSEPTIHQNKHPNSIAGPNGGTESTSDFKASRPDQIKSESSTLKGSADQPKPTSSSDVTSSTESSSSRSKAKMRGPFPVQPLQRLTHFSQQVMDTVSRQLEPQPNEESNPLQRQQQFLSKNSEQNRKDQTINPVSSQKSVGEDTPPSQGSDGKAVDKNAVTSIQSDIQAKPFSPNTAPDTAIHSKSKLSSNEQEHPKSQSGRPTDVTADENLQTQELPTVQKAEASQSSIPTPLPSEQVDFPTPSSIEESSPREGHNPALVAQGEAQPNAAQPGWQTIQNQFADRITNLGSEIKERVDRSIRKQSSRGQLPHPMQIKEAGSVEPATSSEVGQKNISLQSVDVPELNGDNIQASAEPSSDKVYGNEQPLLTDSVPLASTSNPATESLVQTDVSPAIPPSLAEDTNHPPESTTEPIIQSSSVDKAKTPQPPKDSGQNDPALLSGNENSIQRIPDSSEIISTSSEQPMSDVSSRGSENRGSTPKSSQSRNLPLKSHISKIGTTIVQQLANLRPKKTKSKRQANKQKTASSPTRISSENTGADTPLRPTLLTEQEETSPSTHQPNPSERPDVPTQSSPTTEHTAVVQRQHDTGDGSEAASARAPMASDQPSRNRPHSSIQPSEIPSPLTDSSIERHSSTAEIIQKQPIAAEGINSKPLDSESSSSFSEPNLQHRTELSSLPTSDSIQLSPQKNSITQSEARNQATSIPSSNNSIQRQDITHQQSSQFDNADDRIKQSKAAIPPSSHSLSQAELSLQESTDSDENSEVSNISNPPINQDNLLQRQTIQEPSQPDRPNAPTPNLLDQHVLETESHPPERPPISEISVQTKVEQPSITSQIQQQLPAGSDLSVQKFSEEQVQLSTKSKQSDDRESPKVVIEVNLSEATSQNLDSTNINTSQSPKQDDNLPNGASPTIQAKVNPPKETVSDQSLSASDLKVNAPDHTAIAATQNAKILESQENNVPQAPSNTSDTASITETGNIVQRKIGTHSDSNQPLVAPRKDVSDASKPLHAQAKAPETPVLDKTSAQTDPNTEISKLLSKQASTVPIQAIEISVVQPAVESQLQKGSNGQSYDNCDRIQESPPDTGDHLSIQPTPESQPSQPIDQPEQQQATPNSHTSPTANTSPPDGAPRAAIEPAIQASSIEQSHDPSTAPTDISEASEIIQPAHQPSTISKTKIDSDLPTPTTRSAQATPAPLAKPSISDTKTPDLQQLPTENIADSSPQKVESIQSQPDKIESLHRRVIEITAQRPDGRIENANLPSQDISSSPSSDPSENQILQKNSESHSSQVETEFDPAHTEISSNVVQRSEVTEPPQVKPDSKIQISDADRSDSSLASTQPLSSPPIKPTIQRQDPSGGTLDALEIDQINAQPDSTDLLQGRVIEIAAQPPELELPQENAPDLTVAQLLATGQAPSPLSSIADNFVAPKLISSLLPASQSNRKHRAQKLSHLQSSDIPLDLSPGDTALSEEGFEANTENAIAPTIQPSALPSNWSSIEDLFTVQSPSAIQRQAEPQAPVPEDTSDLVLTPTGIYPEQRVQRKTASVRRTAQTLQKAPAAPPPVSSPLQTTEVVMRQSHTETSTASKVDEQSFEILAREIYHILRQRLEVERERHGGYHSGRLPW